MTTIDIPFTFRCELGEGPHWDARNDTLLFVDINEGVVHRLDPTTGAHVVLPLAPYGSLVVPIAGTDDLVCAVRGDALRLGGDGAVGERHVVEASRPGNRINDGKADPAGRLWCGSMSLASEPGRSTLFRIDERGVHPAVENVTLSNGLDWDVERGRMYSIDSPERRGRRCDRGLAGEHGARRRTDRPERVALRSAGRLISQRPWQNWRRDDDRCARTHGPFAQGAMGRRE